MKHHSKVTIIIPTMNRSSFLKRLLSYYSISGFSGFIYIGDSSNNEEIEKNKESVYKFQKSLNIKHFEHPSKSQAYVNYCLLQEVKTEFVSYLADDDIIVTSSIDPAIDLLIHNKDVAAVNGRSFLIRVEGDKGFGSISYAHPYDLSEIKDEFVLARLEKHYKKMRNIITSIQRTKNLTETFKEISKLSDLHSIFVFSELIHSTMTLSRGKVKKLDNLFLVRQFHSNQFYAKTSSKLFDWMIDKDWSTSYHLLEKIAIEGLEKSGFKNNDPKISFQKLFLNHYIDLLEKYEKKINNKKIEKDKYKKTIKNHLKNLLIKFHLYNFAKFIKSKVMNDNSNLLHELLDTSSKDHQDFMPLYNIINNTDNKI